MPELMDWSTHYPAYFSQPNEDGTITQGEKKVEWADVGCGFGGLLMALAPLFPEKLMLGTSTRRFSMNTRSFKLTLYTSLWSPLSRPLFPFLHFSLGYSF